MGTPTSRAGGLRGPRPVPSATSPRALRSSDSSGTCDGRTPRAFSSPTILDDRRATTLLRRQLGRDFEKHRFWLIVDSLGFIASGALVLLPGPNIIAYYFAFRMVGHYLSLRGARQGLDVVAWTTEQSAPLSELRRAIGLDADERERRVHDVAAALKLEHLVKFFQRMALT